MALPPSEQQGGVVVEPGAAAASDSSRRRQIRQDFVLPRVVSPIKANRLARNPYFEPRKLFASPALYLEFLSFHDPFSLAVFTRV